ncbi:SgcJ/EcaC family oxidoreductase [Amycolatopsis samaneae]|uniref:SgcJ/EcaC family oxidoreductase n=1 Tax=Amycolatopsis samaneae TaxID=664691 RepID=A0ABW5GA27_9PSEU
MTDTTEIHDLLRRMTEAWNSGDAAAYAGQFTPDAEYVSWLGTRDTGRAAIEATHRFLFEGPLKGVKMASDDHAAPPDIRYLAPDVALVVVDGGKPEHAPQASVVVLTAVREDGRWRLASFQNTRKTTS